MSIKGYLSQNVQTILGLKSSTALATSTGQFTSEIDTAGCEGILFTAIMGASTGDSVNELAVMGSTITGGTFTTLSGLTVTSTTASTGDKLLQIDVKKPFATPFLKARLARNTAASGYGGIIVQKYGVRNLPITDSTTLAVAPVRSTNPST